MSDRTILYTDETVARIIHDGRPHFGAVTSRDPRNQWLANHLARRRQSIELVQAGNVVRWQVRGGLDPQYDDPEARDQVVRWLLRTGGHNTHDLAAAFLRGWVEAKHHRDQGSDQ